MLNVHEGGVQTTVQDWPGRVGYLSLGMYPAGPMDHYAHRLANLLVGNEPGAAALEIVAGMLKVEFEQPTAFALTGADMQPKLNGAPIEPWRSYAANTGDMLALATVKGAGFTSYLAIAGAIDVPDYIGSKSTFVPGSFGGFEGRKLVKGDVVKVGKPAAAVGDVADRAVKKAAVPVYDQLWELEVVRGPQADPEYLTREDMEYFFGHEWKVDRNSNRMGYRLEPGKWTWARKSGGVAGGHPSNILDNGYAVGAINVCGDQPIILCVDGPSLGGFICVAGIARIGFWKVGQVVPGRDRIRFRELTIDQAVEGAKALTRTISAKNIGKG